MTDHPAVPADDRDDWVDALLREDGREHRDAYIEDDGFTSRVMATLPAPAVLPRWRKPALSALWASAGIGTALALPGTVADVAHEVLRVFAQPVSVTGIAAGVVALGVATWAAAALLLRDS